MPVAYVLLNAEIGAERDVLNAVRGVEGVQEAFGLWGLYDVIARVKADTMDKLTQIISEKMPVGKVHSRVTIIVTES